ncbi:HET-domain-containing protein [Setomelanomma holmii]|uniref:HET-domain-containing protein n=1 Tax=Setomelanomma holmii TaxID=210430 RepID=A0A9P4HA26_9PLEO|nr:HET-domain-containing protein [Setomelanomma holmii]
MPLCQLCASISLSKMRGPDHDRMMPHQPTYLALKQSAEADCQLCGFLWTALELGTEKNRTQGLARAAIAHISERYPGRQISLVAWGGPQDALDRIHVITTGDIPESDDDDAPADPTMHPDHQWGLDGVVDLYAKEGDLHPCLPSESDSLTLESLWLQGCMVNHTVCSKLGLDAILPTRVIDVGSTDGSAEPYLWHPRGTMGRYIALSHCWGGKVPLTTTTATLEDRRRSILLRSLPKTFREAVLVTRKLGVRYLWIDSLCILQDSREDWERESAVMGDIYASSYLTIAARGSVNPAGGLFFSRESEPASCRLRYACREHALSGHMHVRSPSFEHESVFNSPLDTRGWVLQERLLSPRIIYFGRQQLHWECTESEFRQDGRAADVTTDHLRQGRTFKSNLDPKGPLPFANVPMPPDDERLANPQLFKQQAHLLRWYNIVSEYTTRDLTFQSDKLPALSGIAKKVQDMTGLEYLAGLWKEDILAGILWDVIIPSNELISSTLPSWSWARLEGRVRFRGQRTGLPLKELNAACDVVGVSYTLSSQHNSFGGIEDAELQIRGRVIETMYVPSSLHEDKFPTTVFSKLGMPVGRVSFDLESSASLRSFCCLLVHNGAVSLALSPTEKNGLHCYERIGYVHMASVRSAAITAFAGILPRVITIV